MKATSVFVNLAFSYRSAVAADAKRPSRAGLTPQSFRRKPRRFASSDDDLQVGFWARIFLPKTRRSVRAAGKPTPHINDMRQTESPLWGDDWRATAPPQDPSAFL